MRQVRQRDSGETVPRMRQVRCDSHETGETACDSDETVPRMRQVRCDSHETGETACDSDETGKV